MMLCTKSWRKGLGGKNRLDDGGRKSERYGQVLKAMFVEYSVLT